MRFEAGRAIEAAAPDAWVVGRAGTLGMTEDPNATGSEARYRAFIANSSEGIWRLELQPPIDTRLPSISRSSLPTVPADSRNATWRWRACTDSSPPRTWWASRCDYPAALGGPRGPRLSGVDRSGRLSRDRGRVDRTGCARAAPLLRQQPDRRRRERLPRARLGDPARHHRAEARRAGVARQRRAVPRGRRVAAARIPGARVSGRHRRFIRRRHHLEGSRRDRALVQRRRGAAVRLHRVGADRTADSRPHPARSSGRRKTRSSAASATAIASITSRPCGGPRTGTWWRCR